MRDLFGGRLNLLYPFEEKVRDDVEKAIKAGVIGDFELETEAIPAFLFEEAAIKKQKLTFTYCGGTVTLKRKKHKCPTCGVEK